MAQSWPRREMDRKRFNILVPLRLSSPLRNSQLCQILTSLSKNWQMTSLTYHPLARECFKPIHLEVPIPLQQLRASHGVSSISIWMVVSVSYSPMGLVCGTTSSTILKQIPTQQASLVLTTQFTWRLKYGLMAAISSTGSMALLSPSCGIPTGPKHISIANLSSLDKSSY